MKLEKSPKIEFKNISQRIEENSSKLKTAISGNTSLLSRLKSLASAKNFKPSEEQKTIKPTMFLLTFNGDLHAKEADMLGEAINAILAVKEDNDEVVIKMNSGGGVVNGYGLVAAEMERIKAAGIKLTVCVDLVAASGGYMAACVADTIVAAPYAYIGSLGVVASIPNFFELLDKHGVKYIQETAGDCKRNVTMFGEATDEQRNRLKSNLEDIHQAFINHVCAHRNIEDDSYDPNSVFSGEHWTAQQTVEDDLNLVDEISTSNDFLITKNKDFQIIEVQFKEVNKKKGIVSKFLSSVEAAIASSQFNH